MKIVHIAAELAPVAKAGGLGDVVFGLSRELLALGHEVEVILPDYPFLAIPQYVEGIYVRKIPIQGEKIYGCPDDAKRFISFCMKAIESIDSYDVLHLHDWHTALVAAFLPRTLLTLHNLSYVGACTRDLLESAGVKDLTPFREGDGYTLLKGGIHHATLVNTVSPTYAKEITSHPYIQPYTHKFSGILNGIDTHYWNPSADSFLPHSFSSENLAGKQKIKEHVRKLLGMPENSLPLVGAITRLVWQKGPHLLQAGLQKTRALGGQFILLGAISDPQIARDFTHLQQTSLQDRNIHIDLTFNEELSHLVYAACDFFLIPSRFEPCGLTQLLAMRYGAVPIVHRTGGLADTVTDQVNGFSFTSLETSAVEHILEGAFSLFLHNPPAFALLQKTGMEQDWSWKKSAQEYLTLFYTTSSTTRLPASQ